MQRERSLELSFSEATFGQGKPDAAWPYLRVLARSSPDDKPSLAKGLNESLNVPRSGEVPHRSAGFCQQLPWAQNAEF